METVTFPLVDEPLALDLVNTRPNTPDGTVDLLATSRGLKAWLALQAHRLSAEPDQITPTGLGEILALREHITTVISEVRQGRRPPVAALQALTDADAVAPRRRELAWVDQT
nr:ABATE domain-containing protein [Geodermatophilaceae bacterium]